MIEIRVNDTPFETAAETTLAEFIATWQAENDDSTTFAVAVNGEFVPRSQYATTLLNPNDALDIVSPVGGG